jgi:hypothetical protein
MACCQRRTERRLQSDLLDVAITVWLLNWLKGCEGAANVLLLEYRARSFGSYGQSGGPRPAAHGSVMQNALALSPDL